jgi:hypothetical protein
MPYKVFLNIFTFNIAVYSPKNLLENFSSTFMNAEKNGINGGLGPVTKS